MNIERAILLGMLKGNPHDVRLGNKEVENEEKPMFNTVSTNKKRLKRRC